MVYETKIIASKDELETCSLFHINTLLWGTKKVPDTCGRLGFVPGEGFYLSMDCREAHPQKTCTVNQGSVCMDSAVEMFLKFFPQRNDTGIYLNFELNAAGAIHAKYGTGRKNRISFPLEGPGACRWQTWESHDRWGISLFVPVHTLEDIYGSLNLTKGSRFACNFYKISETPDIEHYASYSPVPVKKPDFHLPEFFAEAVLV